MKYRLMREFRPMVGDTLYWIEYKAHLLAPWQMIGTSMSFDKNDATAAYEKLIAGLERAGPTVVREDTI